MGVEGDRGATQGWRGMHSQSNAHVKEYPYAQQHNHVPPVEAPLGWLVDSKQSGSLAHMSLVSCQARMPTTFPLYDSTCAPYYLNRRRSCAGLLYAITFRSNVGKVA